MVQSGTPVMVWASAPVWASKNRTAWSRSPVTTYWPSGVTSKPVKVTELRAFSEAQPKLSREMGKPVIDPTCCSVSRSMISQTSGMSQAT